MTGADSPVMADSSTLATPSIDVAVARDHLAGLDDDQVARLQAPAPGHVLRVTVRRAGGPVRLGLGARAASRPAPCPRPSATASARLAKITVSHSHAATDHGECARVGNGKHGGEHGADLDDEHDRRL